MNENLLLAIECMEKNNFDEAKSLSMNILSAEPNNRFALQIAAMALRKLGHAEKATELWRQSLKIPFSNTPSEKELEIMIRIGDLTVRFNEKTYFSVDPEALAYANAGAELARMGDLKTAEEFLNKAIQIDPNCELAFYNRGIMAYNNRNFQLAVDCMKEVLRINPGNRKAQDVLSKL